MQETQRLAVELPGLSLKIRLLRQVGLVDMGKKQLKV